MRNVAGMISGMIFDDRGYDSGNDVSLTVPLSSKSGKNPTNETAEA